MLLPHTELLALAATYIDHMPALYRWECAPEDLTDITPEYVATCFVISANYTETGTTKFVAKVINYDDLDHALAYAVADTAERAWAELRVAFEKRLMEAVIDAGHRAVENAET